MCNNSFVIRKTMKTYIRNVCAKILIFQCFSLSCIALPRLLAEEMLIKLICRYTTALGHFSLCTHGCEIFWWHAINNLTISLFSLLGGSDKKLHRRCEYWLSWRVQKLVGRRKIPRKGSFQLNRYCFQIIFSFIIKMVLVLHDDFSGFLTPGYKVCHLL